MNAQVSISRVHLDHAEAVLRDLLVREFNGDTGGQAGSLRRMLVHIVNINRAVSISPESHANAAKRLGDFAVATSRMVRMREAESATQLTKLAEALRAASSGLHTAADAGQPASATASS